jgi:DNA anti-recombination protein RmuC
MAQALPFIFMGLNTLVQGAGVYVAVKNANEQRDQAKKQGEEMKQAQEKQLAQAEEQFAAEEKGREELINKQNAQNEQSASNFNRDMQQTRQRKLAQGGQSYRDNILTGPLGIPSGGASAPNTARKSLLGV